MLACLGCNPILTHATGFCPVFPLAGAIYASHLGSHRNPRDNKDWWVNQWPAGPGTWGPRAGERPCAVQPPRVCSWAGYLATRGTAQCSTTVLPPDVLILWFLYLYLCALYCTGTYPRGKAAQFRHSSLSALHSSSQLLSMWSFDPLHSGWRSYSKACFSMRLFHWPTNTSQPCMAVVFVAQGVFLVEISSRERSRGIRAWN